MKNFIEFKDMILINFTDMNEEEQDKVLSMRNDKRIRRWMVNDKVITREEHKAFMDALKTDTTNHYFLVKRNEYNGVVSLNRYDSYNRRAYLGIYANPDLSGKGAGTACMQVLLYLAFEVFGLHTLKLEVISDNIRAIQLYEKFGFEREGCFKDYLHRNSSWQDMLVMGLNENFYQKNQMKLDENNAN